MLNIARAYIYASVKGPSQDHKDSIEGEVSHDKRVRERVRIGGHATIQRQCVCCRLAGGRGEVFTRVWDARPDEA